MLKRALLGTILSISAISAYADDGPRCRDLPILIEFNSKTYAINGTLCRAEGNESHQIDVMVHGATYTRSYWDWPLQPDLYSYVRRTLEAGRSTFVYDRLGIGENANLGSTLVDVQADADVLHEVIQHLINHHGFKEVNLIAHSFGSVVAVREQSQHHDANRLVATGLLHATGPGQAIAAVSTYPAFMDPLFVSAGLDAGWRTTIPGARGKIFYYLPTTDPTVLAYDESHKSILSFTQLLDALNDQLNLPPSTNPSRLVTAPVLAISGQFDTLSCGLVLNCNDESAVNAFESQFYPSSSSFTAKIVSNTGHDLNLHTTAEETFDLINEWIKTH